MALFGSMMRTAIPYGPQAAPALDAAPKVYDSFTARRRGLFGRAAQWLTPDRMQIIGATLRDMGDGGDHLAQLTEQMNQRGGDKLRQLMAQAQLDQANAAQKSAAQQQAAAEQYITSLPANQQPRARMAYQLDPEEFVKRMLGGPQGSVHMNSRTGTMYDDRGNVIGRDPNWFPPANGGSRAPQPSMPQGFDWED